MITARDFELVGDARGLGNSKDLQAQEAACRIAGAVEHIANTEGVPIGEAIQLFAEQHKHSGGYFSQIKRCVDYDAA